MLYRIQSYNGQCFKRLECIYLFTSMIPKNQIHQRLSNQTRKQPEIGGDRTKFDDYTRNPSGGWLQHQSLNYASTSTYIVCRETCVSISWAWTFLLVRRRHGANMIANPLTLILLLASCWATLECHKAKQLIKYYLFKIQFILQDSTFYPFDLKQTFWN